MNVYCKPRQFEWSSILSNGNLLHDTRSWDIICSFFPPFSFHHYFPSVLASSSQEEVVYVLKGIALHLGRLGFLVRRLNDSINITLISVSSV